MNAVPELPVASYCTACGHGVIATAIVCPQCGSAVNRTAVTPPAVAPKDKTVSVLLAVFLGFWTWLYTYRDDAAKFWTVLGVQIFGWLVWILVFSVDVSDPFSDYTATGGATVIGWLLSFGFWLWAVIHVSVRDRSYYDAYSTR